MSNLNVLRFEFMRWIGTILIDIGVDIDTDKLVRSTSDDYLWNRSD